MGKTFYWVDDTQCLSLGGCKGHPEKDLSCSDQIPEWYPEEYPERFDKFCQGGQISAKPKLTFSEKKENALQMSKKTVDKLRLRVVEQTQKIKDLEKKVADFEISFDELSDLDDGKEEIKQLKTEIKHLGESNAALKSDKIKAEAKVEELGVDKELLVDQHSEAIKVLEDEKADWENIKGNKKALEKLLKGLK